MRGLKIRSGKAFQGHDEGIKVRVRLISQY
jgi:hypothetical protein